MFELNGPENVSNDDVMDPNDEAPPAKPKRTRAPNKAKGGESGGGVKAETGSWYILLKGTALVECSADPAESRKMAAEAIIDPEHSLFRAERIEPDEVFQK